MGRKVFGGGRKERQFKHLGISSRLYLKEREFHYHHRDEVIFDKLVEFLPDIVPELPELNASLSSGS